MNQTLRLSLSAGLVVAGVFGMSFALPRWPAQTSSASPDLPEAGGRMEMEQRWSDELDVRLAEAARKIEAKRQTVRALAAGQLSLLEAAARFRELDRKDPHFPWPVFRRHYPYPTDEERHCRAVIATAESEFWPVSSEAATLVARLNAELAEHRKEGRLRLPGD